MPKWLIILLIDGGAVLLLLVVGGFMGAMALRSRVENVEQASKEARVEGEVFGLTSTPKECLEETVHRAQEFGGSSLTCLPPVSAFLWACVEGSNYDPAFRDEMPTIQDDRAVMDSGRRVCARYGRPEDEQCARTLATIIGFCELKREES